VDYAIEEVIGAPVTPFTPQGVGKVVILSVSVGDTPVRV
jgi:hypothetical protein